MRLKDDFYKITGVETLDDGFRCTVQLNAGHRIFKAHFPNNPITPGVCLMQMTVEMLEEILVKQLTQDTIPSVKFRKAMTSDVVPTFTFSRIVEDGDNLSLKVSVEADGEKYVNMLLRLKTVHSL